MFSCRIKARSSRAHDSGSRLFQQLCQVRLSMHDDAARLRPGKREAAGGRRTRNWLASLAVARSGSIVRPAAASRSVPARPAVAMSWQHRRIRVNDRADDAEREQTTDRDRTRSSMSICAPIGRRIRLIDRISTNTPPKKQPAERLDRQPEPGVGMIERRQDREGRPADAEQEHRFRPPGPCSATSATEIQTSATHHDIPANQAKGREGRRLHRGFCGKKTMLERQVPVD